MTSRGGGTAFQKVSLYNTDTLSLNAYIDDNKEFQ